MTALPCSKSTVNKKKSPTVYEAIKRIRRGFLYLQITSKFEKLILSSNLSPNTSTNLKKNIWQTFYARRTAKLHEFVIKNTAPSLDDILIINF